MLARTHGGTHAKRLVLLFATFLVSLFATAASVEERSPFRQGHWWDPSRSGHGFEILSSAGQVMVVWYTYDDGGRPIWYTAQGTQASMGTIWPLQKHRWDMDRVVESTNVGIMRVTVNHFEEMTVNFQVGTGQGTWKIVPFVQSGVVNEVDLTGHWYDPASSGWGMTLLDQGDVFGAVIYAYDGAGQPTWVAGFDRGKGTRVALYWTRGTCPSCAYQPIGSSPAGAIDIAYRGDTEVTVRGAPTVPLAAGLNIDGAKVSQLGRPASTRRGDYQLANFSRETTLKAFLAAGMENRIFSSGGSDFSAAPPAPSAPTFSTTNLQVQGVDEADLVKTNGRYVYAVTPALGTYANAYRTVRIADTGVDGSTLEPVGGYNLTAGTQSSFTAGLYLHEDRLVSIASSSNWGGWYYTPSATSETHVEIRDLANPTAPALRWHAKLTGQLVSSRRIADRLYVVTRFTPNLPGYVSYAWTDAMRATNRQIVEAAPLAAMMPTISVDGGAAVPLVAVSDVHAPQLGGRKAVADLTVVSAIDLRELRLAGSLAIAGRTDAMYMSTTDLFLASTRYEARDYIGMLAPPQPALMSTDIHQIGVDATAMRIVASGTVEGTVAVGEMTPFRFDQQDGRLRVVSSTGSGMWGQGNANRLTILQPSAIATGMLKTVSYLPNARRPEPIGKPNEFLHSTRFVADRLYAVTFKKVDPLYVIDVSDASDPRIAGALEIPGFSDYLHPLANGLLLGFGKDTRPSDTSAGDGGQFAWYQGLHLTLFDVSNPNAPRQMQRILMGKRGSDSPLLYTHHAFSALGRADGSLAIAIPATITEGIQTYDSQWLPWDHSGLLRFELRGSTPADARLEQLPTLVSERASSPNSYPPYDYDHADRSVLYPANSVFVSKGRFWRQDGSGASYGPY
jgi:uncharacterized secreted protein with C-terminal beta-propeller domain